MDFLNIACSEFLKDFIFMDQKSSDMEGPRNPTCTLKGFFGGPRYGPPWIFKRFFSRIKRSPDKDLWSEFLKYL